MVVQLLYDASPVHIHYVPCLALMISVLILLPYMPLAHPL